MVEITAILPIKINSHHEHDDLDRAASLLIPSLERYADPDFLKRIIIIAVHDELPSVRDRLDVSKLNLNIEIIDEDLLCPTITELHGWYKQQVVKLGVSRIIDTDYYLTLDADVILCRPLTEKTVFIDGKPIFTKTKKKTLKWWEHSNYVLKKSVPHPEFGRMFGVTPAMMVTHLVRDLIAELMVVNETGDWQRMLMSRPKWTEYTLYWIFLNDRGLTDRYYSFKGPDLYDEKHSLWTCTKYKKELLTSHATFNHPHHFIIIQSRSNDLSVPEIVDVISDYWRRLDLVDDRSGD